MNNVRLAAVSAAALVLAAARPVLSQSSPAQPAPTTTPEANKAVVRALYERVFNQHDLAAADSLMRPDYIQHNPNVPGGREGFKQALRQMAQVVPDAHVQILHLVAEGDLVVAHVLNTATIPGTTQKIEQPGLDLFRVQDGKLAEHWDAERAQPAPAAPPAQPQPATAAPPQPERHPVITPPHPDTTTTRPPKG
jgi:predicted SnoaL-like aldol condensation-catalyzing enzyme